MTEKQICDYYKYYHAYAPDAISVLAAVNKTTEAAIKDLLIRNGMIKESEEEPMAKVSPEMQEKIYQLWKEEGLSQKAIAERFGISGSMVSYIINRMKPKTNAAPEAKTETKKEPAQAVAGQANIGSINTVSIPQNILPVKSFMEFLPILPDFVRTHFGDDVKIFDLTATDDSERPDKDENTPILKIAEIRFFLKDGKQYSVTVRQEEE